MKFKPGDKVKVFAKIDPRTIWVDLMDDFLGKDAVIIRPYHNFAEWHCYDIGARSPYGNVMWFPEESLELLSCTAKVPCVSQHSNCPRCNGKLVSKEAEEPFTGEKYTIYKCQSCGWC